MKLRKQRDRNISLVYPSPNSGYPLLELVQLFISRRESSVKFTAHEQTSFPSSIISNYLQSSLASFRELSHSFDVYLMLCTAAQLINSKL